MWLADLCTSRLAASPLAVQNRGMPTQTATTPTQTRSAFLKWAFLLVSVSGVLALPVLVCRSQVSPSATTPPASYAHEGLVTPAIGGGAQHSAGAPAGTPLYRADGAFVGWIGSDESRPYSQSVRLATTAHNTTAARPIYVGSGVAENGGYYGQISDRTGRPRTQYVHGYYRKDGTYVRSYYRSH